LEVFLCIHRFAKTQVRYRGRFTDLGWSCGIIIFYCQAWPFIIVLRLPLYHFELGETFFALEIGEEGNQECIGPDMAY